MPLIAETIEIEGLECLGHLSWYRRTFISILDKYIQRIGCRISHPLPNKTTTIATNYNRINNNYNGATKIEWPATLAMKELQDFIDAIKNNKCCDHNTAITNK